MKRIDIIELLKTLDSKLSHKLEIHVCGGAACILSHNLNRETNDIDIIKSIPNLETVNKEIDEIEKEFNLFDKDKWINNSVSKLHTYLQDDYLNRCNTVDYNFNNLIVKTLSAIDIVITKLAVHLNDLSGLHDKDIIDIENIKLDKSDKRIILEKLEIISEINPDDAKSMSNILFKLRPELYKKIKYDKNDIIELNKYFNSIKKIYKIPGINELYQHFKDDFLNNNIDMNKIKELMNKVIDTNNKKDKNNEIRR